MPEPRRRHLLDPTDLHGSHMRSQGTSESLSSVQRWVMSILVGTTILHLSAGLAVAAAYVGGDRPGARVGLFVIAGITGVAGVVAGRAIHGARPLSLWPLLGVVPAMAVAVFVAR